MKRVTIYGCAAAAVVLVFAAGIGSAWLLQPKQRVLTQADIDSAVMHTLQTKDLPSRTARAAEAIRASVVEVRSFPHLVRAEPAGKPDEAGKSTPDPRSGAGKSGKPDKAEGPGKSDKAGRQDKAGKANKAEKAEKAEKAGKPDAQKRPQGGQAPGAPPQASASAPSASDERAGGGHLEPGEGPDGKPEPRHIGSGVVITEGGLIITNFHVVAGARRLEVQFHDGHTAEATVVQAIPEKDLAILQPKSIPDDLPPATLGSSRGLVPGTEVVAVGFPFGIGPSVSAGVISGLDREFVSADERQNLDKLIQFDAAVNPGNSGGPLINMNGEVVGIVTAILNPEKSGTFVGIGFAVTIESAGGALGSSPF